MAKSSAKRKVIPINEVAEKPKQYVPPSLERSGSQSIAPLKDRHKGQTCYVVGKGPSLANLKAWHFGAGPVIAINEVIRYVGKLGLPNQIYSMQKDGCMTEDPHNIPRPCSTCHQNDPPWQRPPVTNPAPGIAVLFSQHLSSWCLHGRPNRFVFTDEELGYGGYPMTMSVLEAVPLALHFGCQAIVMMCFDSITHGDLETLNPLDDKLYSIDYRVADIGADVQEMRYNLEWVKPHLINSLEYIPHSWFTPRAPEPR